MANSAQITSGISTLVQPHFSSRLVNLLFNQMPMLYFLLGRDGDKNGHIGLGRPKVKGQSGGVFYSGVETARAHKETILSSLEYRPIIQKSGPAITDGKTVGMADNTPSRTSWALNLTSSYFVRPRVKWCERLEPYKVSKNEIRHTRDIAGGNEIRAWGAIESLFKAETVSVGATHAKYWNQRIWGTGFMDDGVTANTGAPSNEDSDRWNNVHSMKKALDTTSTYCGVDRTLAANAYWKGADTSGHSAVFDAEELVNYCNYDLGLSAKGMGVSLALIDGTNFKKAKSEAKAKGHKLIHSGDTLPGYGKFGFMKELVQVDNTYFAYDPECPTGEAAFLNLETWTFAVHPDANFKITEPFDQSQVEGGDIALAGYIDTQVMLVCEAPSMNAYFTGLTS